MMKLWDGVQKNKINSALNSYFFENAGIIIACLLFQVLTIIRACGLLTGTKWKVI